MSTQQIVLTVVLAVVLVAICAVFTAFMVSYRRTSTAEIERGLDDPKLVKMALVSSSARGFRKAMSILWKVIVGIILVVCLFAVAVSVYAKASGDMFPISDTAYLVVTTGSMSEKNSGNAYLTENSLDDQIQSYDVIELKSYSSQDEVSLYDVVAYTSDDGRTIVHRIISIVEEDGEVVGYVTRGDANLTDDNAGATPLYSGYLTYDDIIGYYDGTRIPYLGYAVVFLQSASGILTVVALVYCFVVYDAVAASIDRSRKGRTSYVLDCLGVKPGQTEDVQDIPEVSIGERTYSFISGKLTLISDGSQKEEN